MNNGVKLNYCLSVVSLIVMNVNVMVDQEGLCGFVMI